MQTLTATNARNNFFLLLKKMLKTQSKTKIKSKSGNLIMMPEEEYEELIETAELSMIPNLKESLIQADKDIHNKNLYSIDEAFSN